MKQVHNKPEFIVPGFTFSAQSAGIKKNGDMDLALIMSEIPAVMAGVFTKNKIKAAPVQLGVEQIRSGKGQAVIINSGNANACTGKQGLKDALTVSNKTAQSLGISPELVYVSSTGIIGRPLPVSKILSALPSLVGALSASSLNDAARAIMTTDTFVKIISKKIRIGAKTGTVAAITKGAGMICPNMATMLCYILTDISFSHAALDSALREAVDQSFNMLSIDNDMSTNDTALIMSNGMLGNSRITTRSPYFRKFRNVLNQLTYELARMMALDGEGATKFIEVHVRGAKSESDARKAAKAVSSSMLVKTAIYGKDPNWGRIIAAIGYSGAEVDERNTDISINNIKLVHKGLGTAENKLIRKILAANTIIITVHLGTGTKSARALSCDLTEGYIKINAHYST